MFDEKFFLQSKTVLALLLTLLVQVAPLAGLSFSADTASLISENVDKVVTGVLVLFATWTRITANTKLVVVGRGKK